MMIGMGTPTAQSKIERMSFLLLFYTADRRFALSRWRPPMVAA